MSKVKQQSNKANGGRPSLGQVAGTNSKTVRIQLMMTAEKRQAFIDYCNVNCLDMQKLLRAKVDEILAGAAQGVN